MSHTLQLIFWFGLTGLTIGVGLPLLSNYPIYIRVAISILWGLFMISNMSAFWALGNPNRHDWINRIGMFIRGLGFLFMAIGFLFVGELWCVFFGFLGFFLLVLGRACWELIVIKENPE